MDIEELRRENEALKRALEEAKQRELESAYQKLKASEERERLLLGILEVMTLQWPPSFATLMPCTLAFSKSLSYPTSSATVPPNDDVPLRQRILHYFETYPGPHTVSEARKAIGTSKSVKDALLYLHSRGEIERVARGTYQIARPASATRPQKKPNEPSPSSLLGRVLAYVRDAGNKRVRPWQVMNDLGLERSPGRELSKLAQRKLIHRVEQSVYTAEPPDAVDISDAEEQKPADDKISN
jgi:hypothetical protein